MIKPVVTYKGANLPIALCGVIISKREGNKMVNWLNKAELTDFIDTLPVPEGSDTLIYAVCGCKNEYVYATEIDIPDTNVTCPCGRKIIEYGR